MRLQGLTPERPLTHDLFATTLEELGAGSTRVVIAELAEETFHARLYLEREGHAVEVDARPSDALALAVRVGAPIFAAPIGPRPGSARRRRGAGRGRRGRLAAGVDRARTSWTPGWTSSATSSTRSMSTRTRKIAELERAAWTASRIPNR